MKSRLLLRLLAGGGLLLILTVSILFAAGIASKELFLYLLITGTGVWFIGIIISRRFGGKDHYQNQDENET